jgi:hypothetical protein
MIRATESKLHWNYYLALERDMEQLSRYVELCEANLSVYSIELAHLLFAAASEVDVVTKALCELLDPGQPRNNIEDYRAIISARLPKFAQETVYVPRYGLSLQPWESWSRTSNPLWWRGYNEVKHRRDEHFNKANLNNALNALAGLLVAVFYYYWQCMICEGDIIDPWQKDVTQTLEPQSTLLRLEDGYYYDNVIA